MFWSRKAHLLAAHRYGVIASD